MRRGLVVVALALVATLLYAETRAEVRAITDRRGEYKMTRVLTSTGTFARAYSGRDFGRGVWRPLGRTTLNTLNPDGDKSGDMWPTISENTVAPNHPWVIWSRFYGAQFNLAWSRWGAVGWDPVRWVGAPAGPGQDLDSALDFDRTGRPYLAWWRERDDGHGEIFLSFYMQTRRSYPFRVSGPGVDGRYPSLDAGDGRVLRVFFDTPDGTVEQLVMFDRPDTITDDINPLDYLYNGTATISEKDD